MKGLQGQYTLHAVRGNEYVQDVDRKSDMTPNMTPAEAALEPKRSITSMITMPIVRSPPVNRKLHTAAPAEVRALLPPYFLTCTNIHTAPVTTATRF